MKKYVVLACAGLFAACILHALEVDIDELKKAKKVEFQNYRGTYARPVTVTQIKSIGRGLAREVKRTGPNRRARYLMKYSIIEAFSKKEPEKLSADIFIIDQGVSQAAHQNGAGHSNASRSPVTGCARLNHAACSSKRWAMPRTSGGAYRSSPRMGCPSSRR